MACRQQHQQGRRGEEKGTDLSCGESSAASTETALHGKDCLQQQSELVGLVAGGEDRLECSGDG
jgi:hypothetical protein